MERPTWKPPGTPVNALDPPALVVDLDAMAANLRAVHGFFQDRPARLRPYASTHRCPSLAHRQLAAGGTVGGLLVDALGEAEVFAQQGIHDITIVNPVVPAAKIARLCSLLRTATIRVNVDDASNVRSLSEAAAAAGVAIPVLIALRSSPTRFGVAPGDAVALARTVAGSPGLTFAGLSGYGAPENSGHWFETVLGTRHDIEKDGIPVPCVSVGSSRTYQAAGVLPGVTEVVAGAYLLSDARHAAGFTPAARVLASVISRPEPGLALLNAGHKAMTGDTGMPQVVDPPRCRITRMSAEHGFLEIDREEEDRVDLGTRVWAVPSNVSHAVNVYDYLHLARGGVLESVVPVAARGFYR